ncbi:hypothetical protein MHYP_G00316630 [Metynnis hypsauchen]
MSSTDEMGYFILKEMTRILSKLDAVVWLGTVMHHRAALLSFCAPKLFTCRFSTSDLQLSLHFFPLHATSQPHSLTVSPSAAINHTLQTFKNRTALRPRRVSGGESRALLPGASCSFK